MNDGFIKVASATPEIKLADCIYNAGQILKLVTEANERGISIIVFPELCITGYTCADLFLGQALLRNAESALYYIAEKTSIFDMIIIIGLPYSVDCKLYNCAAVLYRGKILGLVPKINIPNYTQYSEKRYFSSGDIKKTVNINGNMVPFGKNLIFAAENVPNLKIGIEICEDLWVPTPPSNALAEAGATIIANLSGSDENVGKKEVRRNLVRFQSNKLVSAYIYSNTGIGESSTDLVYSGHSVIAENGVILSESEAFTTGLTIADVDISLLAFERRRLNTFKAKENVDTIWFNLPIKAVDINRKYAKFPFIDNFCNCSIEESSEEVLRIQTEALITRLKGAGIKKVVLGISGGLDSTLALAVVVRAFDKLKLKRSNIIAVTMPGFGTSEKTRNNAIALSNEFGVSLREISIEDSVKLHFKNIGKFDDEHDIVYENAQARERTQVLMDLANMEEALVVGTGNLSEIAMGFSTYNGDHMSMYGINSGVPKSLIREVLRYESKNLGGNLEVIINNIINTPISPELLPSIQNTEEIIGPYELHDFFLYYFLRYGFSAQKILRIANLSFGDQYTCKEIKKWFTLFIKRFFKNQFKRSCLPDGPKVLEISLSPRNSFMMPSDVNIN